MHLHTFVDHERKHSKNGDEEVVLVMIQITGDPSTERTTPPRSTHVRDGRRLLILDPARGKERLMKIQQHDGVVVDAAVTAAGLHQALWRRRRSWRGEGGARGWCEIPPLPPTIYRGAMGGAPALVDEIY